MFTATTIPLILLSVVLWRWTKGDLLSIILFLSIFEAASGLNIGGMGIPPWILVFIFGLLLKCVKAGAAPRFMSGLNIGSVRLLLLFVVYAVFTGLLYPFIFEGVSVISSHGDEPLAWGMANVTQISYLIAAASLFLMAVLGSRESLQAALKWYVRGCVVASFFALYQLANATMGIPYPTAVIASNPRYVIYPAYQINGMWRLSSTFTEASAMAAHLSVGIAFCTWNLLTRPFRWITFSSFLLMTVALVLTISTSGYLTFFLIVAVIAVLSLLHLFRTKSFSREKAILLLLLVSVAGATTLATNAPAAAEKIFTSVFLEKQSSASYKDRTASNQRALEAAQQTYYLGAGWGSVRCSSLGSGLLGTIGVPGLSLFVVFLLSLLSPMFKRHKSSGGDNMYGMAMFGVFVILADMMIASNEPVQPILWVLFAACVAGPQVVSGVEQRQFVGTYQLTEAIEPLTVA